VGLEFELRVHVRGGGSLPHPRAPFSIGRGMSSAEGQRHRRPGFPRKEDGASCTGAELRSRT